jgi:hypothetical protein
MSKQRINFSTYSQEFYTGSQCKVFFGSIYADEIATIQYQTSNSKTPLYGYGDHQFRTVVKGQFLVRGSFTVAFKETGYLNSIMNLIRAENQGTTFKGEKSSAETFRRYISQGYTVEQALDIAAGKGESKTFGGGTPTSDFEDISEVMEDIIWGKTSDKAAPERKIPRSDELDYFKYTGNTGTSTDIDIAGFDILLTFGSYREGDDSPEHTMISINDVHITGEALVVSPAGEPLGITYEFFARGLNERVSSAWPVINQQSASNSGDTPVVEAAKEIQTQENSTEPIEADYSDPAVTPHVNIGPPEPQPEFLTNFQTPTWQNYENYTLTYNKPPIKQTALEQALDAIALKRKEASERSISDNVSSSDKNKQQTNQTIVTVNKFPKPGKYSTIITTNVTDSLLTKAKIEAANVKIMGVKAKVIIEGDTKGGKIYCNDWLKTFTGRYIVVGNQMQVDIDNMPKALTLAAATFSSRETVKDESKAWTEVKATINKFFSN